MAANCLQPTNLAEKELVDAMGERAAYKLFMKYEHLGKDRAVMKALGDLDPNMFPVERKRQLINEAKQKVHVTQQFNELGKETGHVYTTTVKGPDEIYKPLESVSEVLNRYADTEYNGSDAGEGYALRGHGFHKVMEMVFRGTLETSEAARRNLTKLTEEEGIPLGFIDNMKKLKTELEKTGSVFMPESLVEDIDNNIAGTVDLIHIKDNGTIDIYDLKASFLTKGLRAEGHDSPWDPIGHFDGYKSRRYHTQLEFYAKLIERMTGIPVSNKYVIPLEVFNKEDDIDQPFTKVKMLPPENVESHENWNWGRGARRRIDAHFKKTSGIDQMSAANPQGVNTLMANLVGNYEDQPIMPEALAEDKISAGRTIKGVKHYLNNLLRRYVPFKNQTDRAAQRNQIIQEEIGTKQKYRRDIAESVFNYLETGKDKYLIAEGFESSALKVILQKYIVGEGGGMMPDLDVRSLASMEGFADKQNWVTIRQGDQMDLVYIGEENLEEKIPMKERVKSIFRYFIGDSLFAKYFTAGEAKWLLKSNLKNTKADAKKLEGTLIMLELKASNPELTFGDAMITSLGAGVQEFATHINPEETLSIIQNLLKSNKKEVREIIPEHFRNYTRNKKLFDWKSYQPDNLKAYTRYITVVKGLRDDRIVKGINDYYTDKLTKQELDQRILTEISRINAYSAKDVDMENRMKMLSTMHAELIGMNIYAVEPIGILKKYFSMPTNINNAIIQNAVSTTRVALSSVSKEFFQYKPKMRNAIQALFADQDTALSKVADITVSNTSKYYEGLFKTVKVDVGEGRTEEYRSMELIDEGSDQFIKLSKAQQKMIVLFNDVIQEYSGKIQVSSDDRFAWKRGRMPLLHDTFANRLYKLMYSRSKDQNSDEYKGLSEEIFSNVEEGFTFDIKRGKTKDISAPLTNPFLWQRNDEFNGGKWDRARGLIKTADGNYIVDPKSNYGEWSTNLEVILDMFVINAIRVEQFNKIMPTFAAAQNILEWQKSNLFEDRLGTTIDWLKVWKEGTLENKSQDAGTVQDKIVRTLNRAASVALIGFRPQTAIFATLAQELTAMSQSVANTFSDSKSFGIKEFTRAGREVWNPKNITKGGRSMIDELLAEYRMFNHDFTSIVNGFHRQGNKSWFKMKHVYGMLNAGDWGTRGQVMVAQMMKDGVWDAYSMKDGELFYDEKKDKRFEGPDGAMLKDAIKKDLYKEGGINPDGTMKRAYSARQSESMKFEADSIVGGFDRETRALYNYWALGKLFMLFKTWLPARLNKGFDSQFNNEVAGSLEFDEDEEGNRYVVWKGKQMEGILFSFMAYTFNLKQMLRKAETAELNQNQKENLVRMMGDSLLMAGAALSASTIAAALTDDKDKKLSFLEDRFVTIIARSTEDLIATYNILQFVTDFGTPISIEYTLDLFNNLLNAAAALPNPNDEVFKHLADNVTVVKDAVEWLDSED